LHVGDLALVHVLAGKVILAAAIPGIQPRNGARHKRPELHHAACEDGGKFAADRYRGRPQPPLVSAAGRG
jgi:hypothetical protein